MEYFYIAQQEDGLSQQQIRDALLQSLEGLQLQKVLIITPDCSRYYSGAGFITCTYYKTLTQRGVTVDVIPALGTHDPLTREQAAMMYPDIPYEELIVHNWHTDVVKLGEVPGAYLEEITEGLWKDSVSVEINKRVLDPSYDLILSVGQVVPHEVVGMASHAKNLFVGVGGSDMINKSHMVGAAYGVERIIGKDHTPARQLFDYALAHYLKDLPVIYVLTVTESPKNDIRYHGLFIGPGRRCLEEAIRLSQQKNITFLPRSIPKCVAYLDAHEFHSLWIGIKAICRTRMAMADGGELIILAPGLHTCGEDPDMDKVIRKYGYCGSKKILAALKDPEAQDLRDNMGAAAHMIHGSSEGRFQITYAVQESFRSVVDSVGFIGGSYQELVKRYDPEKLQPGFNTMPDGEEIYFISKPALGLWISKERF